MELSKLQKEIINAPYNKIVVVAASAAGKTQTMTEKVRQILRSGADPRQVAVITFTNMAAGTLRQRLGEDYKDGLFVGTIHALANYMLRVGGVDTSKLLNEEKFDELFDLIQKHPDCVKPLDWVLLDEAQDSDQMQFDFLFNMIDPTHFFVVGDPRQSIYQFKNSNPELMMSLAKRPSVHLLSLNQNYRNSSNILNYAKRIISPTGLYDDSVPMRFERGTVVETPCVISNIPNRILSMGEFKDWAVLCRTNAEVDNVCMVLKRAGIEVETFKQGDLTNEQLAEQMDKNTVKVLTIHSAKGLEWNNVIVIGTRFYPLEERNVCYVAATRARNNLIWTTKKPQKQKIQQW